jgi:hypothetical protein
MEDLVVAAAVHLRTRWAAYGSRKLSFRKSRSFLLSGLAVPLLTSRIRQPLLYLTCREEKLTCNAAELSPA